MTEEPRTPDDSLARFAEGLRQLRHDADDISYRRLAERVGMSPSALSQAASGRKLPTWNVTQAFVKGCGGEEKVWREQWSQVRRELNAHPTNTTNGQVPGSALDGTPSEDHPLEPAAGRRRSIRVRAGVLVAALAVLLAVAGVIVINLVYGGEGTGPITSDPPTISAYVHVDYKGVVGLYETPHPSVEKIGDPPYLVGSTAELKIFCQVSDGTVMEADLVSAGGVERREVNDVWYGVLPSNYYVPAVYTTRPFGVEGELPPGQPFGTTIPECQDTPR